MKKKHHDSPGVPPEEKGGMPPHPVAGELSAAAAPADADGDTQAELDRLRAREDELLGRLEQRHGRPFL